MGKDSIPATRIQAFPGQKLKSLPGSGDVEITVVPKQVIQFQGIATQSCPPQLTVTVDASGRSRLHYSPATCQAATEACFDGPGLHDLWVPQIQNPFSTISIKGLSSPLRIRVPHQLFDSRQSFKLLVGDGPTQSIPLASPSHSPVTPSTLPGNFPEELEDFFIAMPDNTNTLAGSQLRDGTNEVSKLSDLQKAMLRSLIKEVVSAGGALYDDKDLLSDFGRQGKFYIKEQAGKRYVIFKGYAGLRSIFRGTRYSLDKNYARLQILTISQGPLQAMKQGLPKMTKGTVVGFLFMGLVNTWNWLTEDPEGKFLSDLLIDLASDAVKAVIGGVVAAALIGLSIVALNLTAPVFLVVAGTAVLGLFVGLGLDYLDEVMGTTDSIKEAGRKVETDVKELWEEYVTQPVTQFLRRCESEIRGHYGSPRL